MWLNSVGRSFSESTIGEWRLMVSGAQAGKQKEEEIAEKEMEAEAKRINAEMDEDDKFMAEDAAALAPLPTGAWAVAGTCISEMRWL